MAKDKSKKGRKNSSAPDPNAPWIPMRTGLLIVTLVSVGMAAFTIWQTYDVLPFMESLRYGLVRGGSLWVIFGIAYAFNRFVRGKGRS